MVKHLYLMRHGETLFNKQKKIQGWCDSPLTDFGIEQADLTIVKSFPDVGLKLNDVVLVNPMVGSPSDTLAYIDECVVTVDIEKFLSDNQIFIDKCKVFRYAVFIIIHILIMSIICHSVKIHI